LYLDKRARKVKDGTTGSENRSKPEKENWKTAFNTSIVSAMEKGHRVGGTGRGKGGKRMSAKLILILLKTKNFEGKTPRSVAAQFGGGGGGGGGGGCQLHYAGSQAPKDRTFI